MPKKAPRPSRRRTATYTTDGGKAYNRPTIKGAPRAKSPRVYKDIPTAVEGAKRLSKRLATRSMSSTRGASFTPGGGRRKPKKAR